MFASPPTYADIDCVFCTEHRTENEMKLLVSKPNTDKLYDILDELRDKMIEKHDLRRSVKWWKLLSADDSMT